jgi:hypothetical protein
VLWFEYEVSWFPAGGASLGGSGNFRNGTCLEEVGVSLGVVSYSWPLSVSLYFMSAVRSVAFVTCSCCQDNQPRTETAEIMSQNKSLLLLCHSIRYFVTVTEQSE